MARGRLSIATKLPLGAAALLLLVLGGMTLAAYFEVRRSALDAAGDRLAIITDVIGNALAGGIEQRSAMLRVLAAERPIAHTLLGRDSAQLARTSERLQRFLGNNTQNITIELWDSAGSRILAEGGDVPTMADSQAARLIRTASAHGRPYLAPFAAEGDSLSYRIVVPVIEGDRAPSGYLVERHPVRSRPASVQTLSLLIGGGARIHVGTANGVWTDMARVVPTPTLPQRVDTGLVRFADNGERVLARTREVTGTPWILLAEFPRDAVLAQADRFLLRAGGLSLLLVLAGGGAAWLLSRRITRPLIEVTEAAEAIAAGQPAPRLTSGRDDEIGRLEASFNTMAGRVEQGRRRLEQRVRERTASLEQANRELEAFSYSVSHDLRAPLRAINGFATMLMEDHAGELTEPARDRVSTILRNGRQMGQLIDDLLAFSRLGRQHIVRSRVDMTTLANDTVQSLQADLAARDIAFDVGSMPPCSGEPRLIQQVFSNLIGNAVKFSKPRDNATIEVGHTDGEGEVAYYVRDNGVGFDPRYADKLFGVFQRLHSASDFEGTGVGLAIVERIVHRHGGRVWAESQVDQGATFFFTIPPEQPGG